MTTIWKGERGREGIPLGVEVASGGAGGERFQKTRGKPKRHDTRIGPNTTLQVKDSRPRKLATGRKRRLKTV